MSIIAPGAEIVIEHVTNTVPAGQMGNLPIVAVVTLQYPLWDVHRLMVSVEILAGELQPAVHLAHMEVDGDDFFTPDGAHAREYHFDFVGDILFPPAGTFKAMVQVCAINDDGSLILIGAAATTIRVCSPL